MRILVPLDGTPLSELALAPARQLALRATDPVAFVLLNAFTTTDIVSAEVGMLVSDRYTYLDQQRRAQGLEDFSTELLVEYGDPAKIITRAARQYDIDLVIIASHIVTETESAIWGSVAEEVACESGIPTLIVRPDGAAFPTVSRDERFTIMTPLDGNALGEAILPAARSLALKFGGEMLLLRALEMTPHVKSVPSAHEEDALAYLLTVAAANEAMGIPTESIVVCGNPDRQIPKQAARFVVDVIAMATHGRKNNGSLLGNITTAAFHQSALPMLIVRGEPEQLAAVGDTSGAADHLPIC